MNILFLVFNRLETTQRVFHIIKEVKPNKFYIAFDGPREGNKSDIENCKRVKDFVIRGIDWNCEVKYLFRDKNLGCQKAVSEGINWFFDFEEEGIILEDDCLVSPTFFEFAVKLLEYYRHDTRIMHISASNFQYGLNKSNYSYYFSRYAHIWGWATWRRAWNLNRNTFDEKELDYFKYNYYPNVFPRWIERAYWFNKLKKNLQGRIIAWSYKWNYTIWKYNGLSIIPEKNLVINIGVGEGATHTKKRHAVFIPKLETMDSKTIKHPTNFVIADRKKDFFTFMHNLTPFKYIYLIFNKKLYNIKK